MAPIGYSHLVLISVVSLLLMVVFTGVFQQKWDDGVWSKCRFFSDDQSRYLVIRQFEVFREEMTF